ncbi:MAG: ParB/RepB/Spo0J family partition protein [Clostridiales bacterium]|jgi:ParB family chromosome partitioning protein|nr:ParB/RepB/Spo0J family partition protein [Clostridiales bacterium]
MAQKKGLGKGLDAFFGTDKPSEGAADNQIVLFIDINKIEPNREQPRKHFEESALNDLAASIVEFGIIQPLIVKDEKTYYSIIAGERRWRAARIAQLEKVPVIVKDYSEIEILEAALIENIQRADLNPVEEAVTYKRLADEYRLTQDQIAQKVGKSRSAIANSLRLLGLDKRVQNFIIENKLSVGHARALLAILDADAQFELAEKVIDDGLSVREIESIVRAAMNLAPEESLPEKPAKKTTKDPLYKSIESDLKTILGTKVNLKNGKNRGKIEIEYYSDEELDRLMLLFKNISRWR